jgi:hypothetical protein
MSDYELLKIRISSVGTRIRLWTEWPHWNWGFFPGKGKIFSLPNVYQTCFGVQPVHDLGVSFARGKAAECEDDHSPPTGTEVKNKWIYIFTP